MYGWCLERSVIRQSPSARCSLILCSMISALHNCVIQITIATSQMSGRLREVAVVLVTSSLLVGGVKFYELEDRDTWF